MDPTATLAALLTACREMNRVDAANRCEDLRNWLAHDGYHPDVDRAVYAYLASRP